MEQCRAVADKWDRLDFCRSLDRIFTKRSFAGTVVDVSQTVFSPHGRVLLVFIRMAHLAEPLMSKGGTLFTMTYYAARWW